MLYCGSLLILCIQSHSVSALNSWVLSLAKILIALKSSQLMKVKFVLKTLPGNVPNITSHHYFFQLRGDWISQTGCFFGKLPNGL